MKGWGLRARLTLLYLCVFGVIQVALCGIILVARERYVRRDFDEQILERTTSIADAVALASHRLAGGHTPAPLHAKGQIRIATGYALIRDAHGAVVERSFTLEGTDLPFTPPEPHAHESVRFETIPAELSGPNRGVLRMATMFVAHRDIAPFYVQVARETSPLEQSIAALRTLMAIVVPLGLVVAGLASAVLARRSLEPVDRITRQAEAITAADLRQRLPVPPGEDELSRLASVLNGMLDRLESAFRAQERFIGDASHELKTPLASVLAEAELLRRRNSDPAALEAFLCNTSEELRRLLRVVECLLILERADAGLGLPDVGEVDVHEFVPEAARACQAMAAMRTVRLVVNLPESDAAWQCVVRGDKDLLRVMLENIIRNAVRFSPEGEAVEIAVEANETEVVLRVRDHGPGIDPSLAPRIFDRFVTFPRTGDKGGLGLGLAIAHGVARLHAGSISAANCEDGGCEFVVRLPPGRRIA